MGTANKFKSVEIWHAGYVFNLLLGYSRFSVTVKCMSQQVYSSCDTVTVKLMKISRPVQVQQLIVFNCFANSSTLVQLKKITRILSKLLVIYLSGSPTRKHTLADTIFGTIFHLLHHYRDDCKKRKLQFLWNRKFTIFQGQTNSDVIHILRCFVQE